MKEWIEYIAINYLVNYLYNYIPYEYYYVQVGEVDIYEDIYQSVISPHRSKLNLSFSRRNKREYPIRELVETEEKYLGRYRYT